MERTGAIAVGDAVGQSANVRGADGVEVQAGLELLVEQMLVLLTQTQAAQRTEQLDRGATVARQTGLPLDGTGTVDVLLDEHVGPCDDTELECRQEQRLISELLHHGDVDVAVVEIVVQQFLQGGEVAPLDGLFTRGRQHRVDDFFLVDLGDF